MNRAEDIYKLLEQARDLIRQAARSFEEMNTTKDESMIVKSGAEVIAAAGEELAAVARARAQGQTAYRFSCGNAFIDGKIITGFDSEAEAVEAAANYEARLYRKEPGGDWLLIWEPGANEE